MSAAAALLSTVRGTCYPGMKALLQGIDPVKSTTKLGVAVLIAACVFFGLWGVARHRNRRQDIATALRLAGYEADDAGRILLTQSEAGLDLAYDPNRYNPSIGFRSCINGIDTCRTKGRSADACVDATPRCVSATPWKDDPAGDDCCPESCVKEYHELRKTRTEGGALVAMTRGGCYPGTKALR